MKELKASFRSKLLLLTIVPLLVAQVVTLFAVMRTVQTDVEARAHESLVIGGEVVAEYLDSRAEQLLTSVEVLSSDFGLKQAVGTGDADTIRSMLENHSRRVGADLSAVYDLDGYPLASSSDEIADLPWGSLTTAESTATIDGTAYQIFTVPLLAPVAIGKVVLGFRVDEELVQQLSDLTGLDVTLVTSTAGDARVIYSTHSEFAPGSGAAQIYSNHGLLTRRTPFIEGTAGIALVMQRSLDEAMLPYVEARRGLLAFSAALLVLVALAGVYFSTSIARPLRSLAEAAQRMISGNYEGDIRFASKDEFGELASSFNAMRLAISEREQRIVHQAMHADLTDLPNRYKLLQVLTGAIEDLRAEQTPVAVLSIKLSRMGEIASTLGHKATDELIVQAARHLRVNLDDDDVLGHTERDEFVLVLPGESCDTATARIERIEQILASGVTLDNIDVSLQAEIGVAAFPLHGDIAAELLRFATVARTEAHAHKDSVRVYEDGREEEFARRLRVVSDLRAAVRHREIKVWYQPKACLQEGDACGVEALVRWEHPELGFLSPDEFVPAAEQAGTIIHLTRYVLAEAVKQCRWWQDYGFDLAMSVNLSARDLTDEYLPYHVLQILKENDVKPEMLTLEVTESSIMQDLSRSVLVLECLRDIGVRISIDDFGTGHSSLAQLKNIPVHELKVDKSFVFGICDDSQNEAIVRATVDLAHSMDLSVVAEGVEDEATMRRVTSLGCEYAQGYFLSKPAPAEEITEFLQKYTPRTYHERRKRDRAFAREA